MPDHSRKNICKNCAKEIYGVIFIGENTEIKIEVKHNLGEIPLNNYGLFKSKSVVEVKGNFSFENFKGFGRTAQQIERHRKKGLTQVEKEFYQHRKDINQVQDYFWTQSAWQIGEREKFTTPFEKDLLRILYEDTFFVFTESGTALYTLDKHDNPEYFFSHLR
jgi:hypothetical protein